MQTNTGSPGARPAHSLIAFFVLAGLFICGAVVFSMARAVRYVNSIDEERTRNMAALNDVRSQVQALSARLSSLTPATPPPPVTSRRGPISTRRAVPAPRPEDARLKQLQDELSDQKRELAGTRDEISKARDDLQGKLDSTRGDLSASIAKNHDELVVLQRRGERDYHEFHLTKSKDFQVVGPISLSLRKTDTKHKSYNLAMLVADDRLDKKQVNLYEPVRILNDRQQPVELIVNQIGKNEVRGYVSEPKYKQPELAENSPSRESKPQQLVAR